jgi:hypothetical protein
MKNPGVHVFAKWVLLTVLVQVAVAAETKVPLLFSGGHETDRRDHGRPVMLVAAALEVKTEVFREAFSGVTPSRNGPPSDEEARRNKAALMKVLQPLGVTDERLNEVSNRYRYQPQKGQLWTHTEATGHAVVENGEIKEIVVDEPGSGYSTPPTVTVEGMAKVQLKVTLKFCKDLNTNGSVASVTVAAAEAPKENRN